MMSLVQSLVISLVFLIILHLEVLLQLLLLLSYHEVKNLQQYIHFTFVTATAKSITKLAGMTPFQ